MESMFEDEIAEDVSEIDKKGNTIILPCKEIRIPG